MNDLPGQLSGTHPLVAWGNRLLGAVRRRTPKPVAGMELVQTEAGFTLKSKAVGGPSAPAGPSDLKKLTLVAVWHDVYECTLSGVTTWVRKEQKLRNSITAETLDGVQYDYTFGADYVTRISTNHTNSADVTAQVITPRFLTNDEIWAIATNPLVCTKIPGGTPTTVTATYEALPSSRAWTEENTA